jgi:hypothetical protein
LGSQKLGFGPSKPIPKYLCIWFRFTFVAGRGGMVLQRRHCGKSLTSLKKVSILLKMDFKSLTILEKASISLKKFSKIILIITKAPKI